MRENLGEELASASLVLNGPSSLLVRSGDELLDLLRRGQGVLNIVPLSGMIEDLEERIAEIALTVPAVESTRGNAAVTPGATAAAV